MVKLSFKSTELAKNFDRSEDSLFKGFQLLKEFADAIGMMI